MPSIPSGASTSASSAAVGRKSQNAHGNADSLPSGTRVTRVNLNDNSVEGLEHKSLPVFSVQYHPEASPGPHDANPLFRRFLESMKTRAAGGHSARIPVREAGSVGAEG